MHSVPAVLESEALRLWVDCMPIVLGFPFWTGNHEGPGESNSNYRRISSSARS
jgi:hypothetical protein